MDDVTDTPRGLDALAVVKIYGQEFGHNFKDYRLLLLYWETLFFSPSYSHQFKANEFLDSNPRVARNIDVDLILHRAVEEADSQAHKGGGAGEDFIRKILEICLRHDLDMYNKSRVVETLLVYQCDSGNYKRACETVKTADNLEISIGADAMKIFFDMKASRSKTGFSFFESVFGSWKKGKE